MSACRPSFIHSFKPSRASIFHAPHDTSSPIPHRPSPNILPRHPKNLSHVRGGVRSSRSRSAFGSRCASEDPICLPRLRLQAVARVIPYVPIAAARGQPTKFAHTFRSNSVLHCFGPCAMLGASRIRQIDPHPAPRADATWHRYSRSIQLSKNRRHLMVHSKRQVS